MLFPVVWLISFEEQKVLPTRPHFSQVFFTSTLPTFSYGTYFKNLLFDFFGTLLRTAPPRYDSHACNFAKSDILSQLKMV